MQELFKKNPYGIYTEENFLTAGEIQQLHVLATQYQPEIASLNNTTVDPSIRRCNIVWLPQNDQSLYFFKKITAAVQNINAELYEFQLDGICNLQYTVYKQENQGHYDWHRDTIMLDDHKIRKLSVIIQLSDPAEYTGGALLMAPNGGDQAEIVMRAGKLVVFPSWTPHCVMPVQSGTRCSLVTWISGDKFK